MGIDACSNSWIDIGGTLATLIRLNGENNLNVEAIREAGREQVDFARDNYNGIDLEPYFGWIFDMIGDLKVEVLVMINNVTRNQQQ